MAVPRLRDRRFFLRFAGSLTGAAVLALLVAVAGHWGIGTGAVSGPQVYAAGAHTGTNLVPVDAQIAGTVIKVHVVGIQYVKAGTVLFELDPANYRVALKQARARMAAAQAKVRDALSALSIQEHTVNSMVRRLQEMQPAVRLIQVPVPANDPAVAARMQQAQRQVAAARVEMLKAAHVQLAAALAQLATAQQTLARDKALVADGLIAARQLDLDTATYEAAKSKADAVQAAASQARVPPVPAQGGSQQVTTPRQGDGAAAAADVAQAQQRVAEAQANVGPAQAAVAAAQQTIDRDQALLAQGAIPAQQLKADTGAYEVAKAQADAAEAGVRQAHAQLTATLAVRQQHPGTSSRVVVVREQNPHETGLIHQAETAVVEAERRAKDLAAAQASAVDAEGSLQAAEADLSRTLIRATVDGWIMHSSAVPGQVVRPNEPVMWLTAAPGQTRSAIQNPAGAAPAQDAAVRRARLAQIAQQERRVLAQINVESARIQSIIVNSVPGQHASPVPTLLGNALLSPMPGGITSGFGWRIHPIFNTREFHTGIDIAAPMGSPIRAAADGTVLFTGSMPANGMLLILYHGNGFSTTYSHLSSAIAHAGDHVRRGQIIARVGSTGWSTGPHLFFELRKDGRPVDPLGP